MGTRPPTMAVMGTVAASARTTRALSPGGQPPFVTAPLDIKTTTTTTPVALPVHRAIATRMAAIRTERAATRVVRGSASVRRGMMVPRARPGTAPRRPVVRKMTSSYTTTTTGTTTFNPSSTLIVLPAILGHMPTRFNSRRLTRATRIGSINTTPTLARGTSAPSTLSSATTAVLGCPQVVLTYRPRTQTSSDDGSAAVPGRRTKRLACTRGVSLVPTMWRVLWS